MKYRLSARDKKMLTAHMGKAPLIINRAFNQTDSNGKMTDKYDIYSVVQNYTHIESDITKKTCFACTINGQCTPYLMSYSPMCNRFNTPAVIKVTIPKKDCKGCINKNKDEGNELKRLVDFIACGECETEGGYKSSHSENFSFYAQEGAGLGGVHNDRDSFQNPQICSACGQLDLKKQRQWALRNENARSERI